MTARAGSSRSTARPARSPTSLGLRQGRRKYPGTCTLTDTRAATAEQAGLYTRLAKTAGSNCNAVTAGYAGLPRPPGRQGSRRAGLRRRQWLHRHLPGQRQGRRLRLWPRPARGLQAAACGKADYAPGLTADLKKFDKKDCTVSAVGQPLKTPTGAMRLEVACSDGLPGYMVEYSTRPLSADRRRRLVACTFAGNCHATDQQAEEAARASSFARSRTEIEAPAGFARRGPVSHGHSRYRSRDGKVARSPPRSAWGRAGPWRRRRPSRTPRRSRSAPPARPCPLASETQSIDGSPSSSSFAAWRPGLARAGAHHLDVEDSDRCCWRRSPR